MILVKKLFIVVFIALNLFAQDYSDDIQKIIQEKQLIVAMIKDDDVPFFMQTKQGLDGFDIRLAKKIGENLGVSVVFDRKYDTYDAVIDAVAQKKAHVGISNLSQTLQRAKKVYFSTSYLKIHIGLAINRKTLASLKKNISIIDKLILYNLPIGVLRNSSYVDFGKKIFNEKNLRFYDSDEEAMQAVENGEIAAFLIDEIYLDQFILNNPSTSLNIQTVIIKDFFDYLSIAISPYENHLLYWLNLFIEQEILPTNVSVLFDEYEEALKRPVQ